MSENEQVAERPDYMSPDSLNDYRSKVGEIIRSENQRFIQLAEEQASSIIEKAWQKAEAIVKEGQGRVNGMLSEGQKKAEEFIIQTQKKAAEIGKEIEDAARQRAEGIIEEARQRGQQIETEAEAEAARQAKTRIKDQEEKMLEKAREDVKAILDTARTNAEQEANGIIQKTREEAGQLVGELTERYRKEAEERAVLIRNEALQRANKLIEDMTRQQDAARTVIAGTLKKSEVFLERINAEIQAEMETLHETILKAREKMEATLETFDLTEGEPDLDMDLPSSQPEGLALWLNLSGTKSDEENGSYHFQGQMELKALATADPVQLREFKTYLSKVAGLRFRGEASGEEGTVTSYDVTEPVPLVEILSSAPTVGRVVTHGDSVRISLE